MEIEIIAFYVLCDDSVKNVLKGTLHIYLPALGIDIRGVQVERCKDRWYIGLPSRRYRNGNALATYPVFCFREKTSQNELRRQVKLKGYEYIKKNYLDKKRG